ncbi:hypothetical protein [Magnetospirillum molischianum]|uniref:Uncharacterized protein n=1 Tax=Magnetospirillum molischianum DSM 120 TaxID=1150626 RepID=H8FQH6_MAGML|nr:hypothetical protein [Magnetospirillum molischianum]CCG40614.1 conserved exported hypothetical protein [Magnetospirillum molischianum DSM 120]
MKRLVLSAVCLIALAATPASADRETALAAVRALPGMLEAQIDDRGNLWAVVKNDRASWNQYAALLCVVVRPHQARVFSARVVDVTSVGRGRKTSEWTVLAQANCGAL